MTQYCRYCSHCFTGNGIYCEKLNVELTEKEAKRTNRCKSFELNPIDAFGENIRGYTPKVKKKKIETDCKQLSLFDDID